jgi:hypothetical protein
MWVYGRVGRWCSGKGVGANTDRESSGLGKLVANRRSPPLHPKGSALPAGGQPLMPVLAPFELENIFTSRNLFGAGKICT